MAKTKKPMTATQAGSFIRNKRLSLSMTQSQVAKKAGLADKYLSAFENGRYHIGKSEHLQAIANILNLNEEEIKMINPSLIIKIYQSIDFQHDKDNKNLKQYKIDTFIKGDINFKPCHRTEIFVDVNGMHGILLFKLSDGEFFLLHSDNPLLPSDGLIGSVQKIYIGSA